MNILTMNHGMNNVVKGVLVCLNIIGRCFCLGAGKTVLLDHCSPRILGDFVPLITSQLRYVSILKCILPVDCKAMHPYTPSLCRSVDCRQCTRTLPPSVYLFPLPFLLPSLHPFLCSSFSPSSIVSLSFSFSSSSLNFFLYFSLSFPPLSNILAHTGA